MYLYNVSDYFIAKKDFTSQNNVFSIVLFLRDLELNSDLNNYRLIWNN